jgi:hypothetical protein
LPLLACRNLFTIAAAVDDLRLIALGVDLDLEVVRGFF